MKIITENHDDETSAVNHRTDFNIMIIIYFIILVHIVLCFEQKNSFYNTE